MSNLTGTERKKYVRNMFGRIAERYDLMNRIMTLGQDIHWRKILVSELELTAGAVVLDLGCGTGDLAREVLRQQPEAVVIAADLTYEMVHLGAKSTPEKRISWVIADAQNLPFAREQFDGVVSGYLLRNVPDVERSLEEHQRVMKPDSIMASLDTTPPRKNLLKPFIELYLKYGIPLLGKLIAGDSSAYTYLPDSTRQFLTAEKLAGKINMAGFQSVRFIRKMFGTMAIHWGQETLTEQKANGQQQPVM